MAPLRAFIPFVLSAGMLACVPRASPPPADVTIPAPTASVATVPAPSPTPATPAATGAPIEPEPVTADDDVPTPPPTPVPPPATSAPAAPQYQPAPVLDPRRSPRAMALLTTELRGLQQLLAATPAHSPDRPALLRRIASDLVELRKAGVASAGPEAIKRYEELVRTFPTNPSIDEDRYYLALEYLVAGNMASARRSFFELIQSSPGSKFVPYAYFAFADVFFDEAQRNPSMLDLARAAYMEVLKFPQSPVAPEAALQLYQVAKAKGDTTLAAKMRALLASQYPTSPAAARARSLP